METQFNNPNADVQNISSGQILSDINHIKTGFAIYDPELKLLFANKTIRGYLPSLYQALDAGLSFSEGIKLQIKNIYPDLSDAEVENRASHILAMIKSSGSMEVTTPSGYKLQSSYDRSPDGNYILTTNDVTKHIRYEEELAAAREKADNANQAKSEFLATMSHEIRTPLLGVFMAEKLLQQQLRMTQNAEMSKLVDILVGSATHLNTIINNVLDLSKIEAGHIDIVRKENSLPDMLKHLTKTQECVAKEKNLELKLVLDPKLPDCLVYDNFRVRQCVINLVNNALKFTVSGSVTVAALFDPDTYMVTIHVMDTGVGVMPEERSKIFEEFSQSKSAGQNHNTGTGLGLTISRKFARLMDGDLTLKSKPGRGSVFTLTFASQPSLDDKTSASEDNIAAA